MDYPPPLTVVNHVAPAPRRVRGFACGETIFDTLRALYVWEWPAYPQYYLPRADVRMDLLVPQGEPARTPQGRAQRYALRLGELERPDAATLIDPSPLDGVKPWRAAGALSTERTPTDA